MTRRCVDVFISKLQPDTTVADIESCTSDIIQKIPNGDPSPVNIKCKHDFYMSFHVEVTVNSDLFATAIDVLMSGDSWPELRHTGTTIFQESQQMDRLMLLIGCGFVQNVREIVYIEFITPATVKLTFFSCRENVPTALSELRPIGPTIPVENL